MTLKSKPVLISAIIIAACVCLLAGIFYLPSKNDGGKRPSPEPAQPEGAFTFFNLGPSTKLSSTLREELGSLFGSGGVETRTTIDLTLDGVDNFPAHFPRLQALHDALNYLPRQRVEHDTVQLTYRYARRQNIPFDRIQLVFSGERETPLFFSLYSKRDGDDFIGSIQNKYGPPETIGDMDAASRTLYWQNERAFLIISITRNRIGFNEYNFGIYYLDNLTDLAETERLAREAAEREKEKTGELAF